MDRYDRTGWVMKQCENEWADMTGLGELSNTVRMNGQIWQDWVSYQTMWQWMGRYGRTGWIIKHWEWMGRYDRTGWIMKHCENEWADNMTELGELSNTENEWADITGLGELSNSLWEWMGRYDRTGWIIKQCENGQIWQDWVNYQTLWEWMGRYDRTG